LPITAPDSAEGAHSAPPDLGAGFKGPTSKRREGKWREGERGRRRGGAGRGKTEGREKEGMGNKGGKVKAIEGW